MRETAVADVGLWCPHQTLADISSPGPQATHKKQIDQEVDITTDGWRRDSKARRQPLLLITELSPEI
jgi:hypothetical protein